MMRLSQKSTILAGSVICVGLLAWGVAWVIRARSEGDAGSCRSHLMYVEALKQHWGMDHKKGTNDIPTWDDLRPYMTMNWGHHQIVPPCPQGGTYTVGRLDEAPKCSIGGPGHSL